MSALNDAVARQKALSEAIQFLADTDTPEQAVHQKVVLEALTTSMQEVAKVRNALMQSMTQVSNVVELLPMENPELIDYGYSIEAKDILEALKVEA